MSIEYQVKLDEDDVEKLYNSKLEDLDEITVKIINQAKKQGFIPDEHEDAWNLAEIVETNSYDYLFDGLKICKENEKIFNLILEFLKDIEDNIPDDYINFLGDILIECLQHINYTKEKHAIFETDEALKDYVYHIGGIVHNILITNLHNKSVINWSDYINQEMKFNF